MKYVVKKRLWLVVIKLSEVRKEDINTLNE